MPRAQSVASSVQRPKSSVQSPASSVQSPAANTCVQSPGIPVCRVQASGRPQSKRPDIQSPSIQSPSVQSTSVEASRVQVSRVQASRVQASRVQASKCPESKRLQSKRPDHASRIQLFRYANEPYFVVCISKIENVCSSELFSMVMCVLSHKCAVTFEDNKYNLLHL